MSLELADHQQAAIKKLRPGTVLYAGVGSGKSRTALAYFFFKECKGSMPVNGHGVYRKMKDPKNLYIITTAKKRDGAEWYTEAAHFIFDQIEMVVDSWNNIDKYLNVKDAFFIFDEQRAVGYGKWAKSFIHIAKANHWIMLSFTPGDTWIEYMPLFIANGFYKNKAEFSREHIIYDRFAKYPKIERYVNCKKLMKLKQSILVEMHSVRATIAHNEYLVVDYDKEKMSSVYNDRWDIYSDKPIINAGNLCYTMRRVVNEDKSRIEKTVQIIKKHRKVIVFYNFDYELEMLREMCKDNDFIFSEWNGHVHEDIIEGDAWVYLVQYTAGSEGWNCISTNTIVFYSLNYSYKQMVQAAGRIDRMNTPYKELFYYRLYSKSKIDLAILNSLKNKRNFNENRYFSL